MSLEDEMKEMDNYMPVRGKSELPPAIVDKYVHQTKFEMQRWKMEEIVRELPEQRAISVIMHCYECSFNPAERIYQAIMENKG